MQVNAIPWNAAQNAGLRQKEKLRTSELALFLLFSAYGPSFNLAGELRYVEAVILVWAGLRLPKLLRGIQSTELVLLICFGLSGVMQIISGFYFQSDLFTILARSGTYFILILLLLVVMDLTRNNSRCLLLVLAAYSVSYVFILLVGTTSSPAYALVPWRLGLGFAATLAAAVAIAAHPRWLPLAPVVFLILGLLHFVLGARSLAALTLLVSLFAVYAAVRRLKKPSQVRLGSILGAIFLILGSSWVGLKIVAELAEGGYLPAELAQKIQRQSSSSVGLLLAARPDAAAAVAAIVRQPILGFGPGVVDPSIFAYYAEIAAEGFSNGQNLDATIEYFLDGDRSNGTPSHSHVLGAWADAGIFAAIVWIIVLVISLRVLVRNIGFRTAWGPLFSLISLATIWDVLFSPGPHRMDIALRLAVLLFALKYFRGFDHVALTAWSKRQVSP